MSHPSTICHRRGSPSQPIDDRGGMLVSIRSRSSQLEYGIRACSFPAAPTWPMAFANISALTQPSLPLSLMRCSIYVTKCTARISSSSLSTRIGRRPTNTIRTACLLLQLGNHVREWSPVKRGCHHLRPKRERQQQR